MSHTPSFKAHKANLVFNKYIINYAENTSTKNSNNIVQNRKVGTEILEHQPLDFDISGFYNAISTLWVLSRSDTHKNKLHIYNK